MSADEIQDEFIAGRIKKTDSEEVRVLASSFKGFRRAHIRQYRTRENGKALSDPAPTIKGVTIELDDLPMLILVLKDLCRAEGIDADGVLILKDDEGAPDDDDAS